MEPTKEIPSSVVSKLRAAKALISDPAVWCQGALGLSPSGKELHDPDKLEIASRVCTIGAAMKVGGIDAPEMAYILDAAAALFQSDWNESSSQLTRAAYLNDHSDHATVMALYDRAIEIAEAYPR